MGCAASKSQPYKQNNPSASILSKAAINQPPPIILPDPEYNSKHGISLKDFLKEQNCRPMCPLGHPSDKYTTAVRRNASGVNQYFCTKCKTYKKQQGLRCTSCQYQLCAHCQTNQVDNRNALHEVVRKYVGSQTQTCCSCKQSNFPQIFHCKRCNFHVCANCINLKKQLKCSHQFKFRDYQLFCVLCYKSGAGWMQCSSCSLGLCWDCYENKFKNL